MKTLCIAMFLLLGLGLSATTQVKVDSNGNYVSVIKSSKRDTVDTKKLYVDSKGIQYPVFKSATGKLYCPRVSKTGKYYRYYLKVN